MPSTTSFPELGIIVDIKGTIMLIPRTSKIAPIETKKTIMKKFLLVFLPEKSSISNIFLNDLNITFSYEIYCSIVVIIVICSYLESISFNIIH